MPTKMRLQRHGKKGSSFFHIVIADNRAPRDGRFIEKIGTYNPNTNPASIDIKFERALNWLQTGAQPTDTVRAILSYEGVLYKNHLNKGVLKGALTQDEADKRFDTWKKEKLGKIQHKIDSLDKAKTDEIKARLKAEEEISRKREQEIIAKTSALAEEAQRASAAKEEVAAIEQSVEATEETEVKAEAETTPEASETETPEASSEGQDETEKSA